MIKITKSTRRKSQISTNQHFTEATITKSTENNESLDTKMKYNFSKLSLFVQYKDMAHFFYTITTLYYADR